MQVNFYSLKFNTDKVQGSLIEYQETVNRDSNKESNLYDLRNTHKGKYLFTRWQRDNNYIACLPIFYDLPILGKEKIFTLPEEHALFRFIAHETLLNVICNERKIWRSNPSITFNGKTNITKQINELREYTDWLAIQSQILISVRTLYPEVGILCNVNTRFKISKTVEQLMQLGVNCLNTAVTIKRPLQDDRFEDEKRKYAGIISSINDKSAILKDSETSSVLLSECFLEPSKANFYYCVKQLIPNEYTDIVRKIDLECSKFYTAYDSWEKIEKLVKWLKTTQPFKFNSNFSFEIKGYIESTCGYGIGEHSHAESPLFVFDKTQTKTHNSADKGIEVHGPYDRDSFTEKKPVILVVTPKQYRGDVEVFLKAFEQGIPHDEYFSKGFKNKYYLYNLTYKIHEFQRTSNPANDYRQACLHAIDDGCNSKVAFVVIDANFRQIESNEQNPYYIAKQVLMNERMAVQEITIENIRKSNGMILNSIGLATYAKLGGTPFVIPSSSPLSHELIFGIGYKEVQHTRNLKNDRFVGITSVFNDDGNYLLSNFSREVSYENYADELLNTLEESFSEIKGRGVWRSGDTVRLIFHSYKKLKNKEVVSISKLIQRLSKDYKVEFAFLHLSGHHDWMVFDKTQKGIANKGFKGKYVAPRGMILSLGPNTGLLTLVGPMQTKTAIQGAPRPLLVHLHEGSTFKDLIYLSKQIYRFTFLSYRSFIPATLPVTMLYSEKIAGLLGVLRTIPNFNADAVRLHLRQSKWFL
jgi:hypothetical protein